MGISLADVCRQRLREQRSAEPLYEGLQSSSRRKEVWFVIQAQARQPGNQHSNPGSASVSCVAVGKPQCAPLPPALTKKNSQLLSSLDIKEQNK